MMINFQGRQELRVGQLAVDDFVPFSFRAYTGVLASPYLWRVGNFTTSLLELKIDKQSKLVLGVTLSLYNQKLRTEIPPSYLAVELAAGLPVANTDIFSNDRHDETREFELVQNGNSFIAVLNGGVQPQRCLRADRVGFYERAGEICGIGFFDLTASEIEKLKSLFQK